MTDRETPLSEAGDGAAGTGQADGSLLFVSYCRRDRGIAQPLIAELEARTQVWLDTQDIAPTAQWWSEIVKAIDASGALVALVSPSFLASEDCQRELDQARNSGKPVIPVMISATNPETAPPRLRAVQWIEATTGEPDFVAQRVVDASRTDLSWNQQHALLLLRAREWSDEGHPKSRLLRGADVATYESLLSAPRNADQPQPAELQWQYVQASRASRTARIRIAAIAAFAVAGLAIALAAIALVQRNNAELARGEAVVARNEAVTAEEAAIEERDRAVSAALLAEAERRQTSDPDHALGLALEVTSRTSDKRATDLIRRVIGRIVEGSQFSRLDSVVETAELSPDGRLAALATNREVSIVDTETGGDTASIERLSEGSLAWIDDPLRLLQYTDRRVWISSISESDEREPVQFDLPIPASHRLIDLLVVPSLGGLIAVHQDDRDFTGDVVFEQVSLEEPSATAKLATIPRSDYVEHVAASPSGRFIGLAAGSPASPQIPFLNVISTTDWQSLGRLEPTLRPAGIQLLDGLCPPETALAECDAVKVLLVGGPYASNDSSGLLEWHSHGTSGWVAGDQEDRPFSLRLAGNCGDETVVVGASGIEVITQWGPGLALMNTVDVLTSACVDGNWIALFANGAIVRAPTLFQAAAAADQSGAASWSVIDFLETDDAWDALEPGAELKLAPGTGDQIEVTVDGVVVATSATGSDLIDEPIQGIVGFGESQPIALARSGHHLTWSAGLNWSSWVTIRDTEDEEVASWRFSDTPWGGWEMDDGTVLGLFTARGDYLDIQWLQFTDEHLRRVACHLGASLPSDVLTALGLESKSIPAPCATD